jgi:hypothetical protein
MEQIKLLEEKPKELPKIENPIIPKEDFNNWFNHLSQKEKEEFTFIFGEKE